MVDNAQQWSSLQTVLGTVGMKGNIGPVSLAGSAWYGKNTGPLLGNIIQFPPYANYLGDIFGYGAWGQAGLYLSKQILGLVHVRHRQAAHRTTSSRPPVRQRRQFSTRTRWP